MIDGWGISCIIALIWMLLDFIDDQSALVQVMAWCHQATSHYLSQYWPRSMSPNGVTRPQWVEYGIAFIGLIFSQVYYIYSSSLPEKLHCRHLLVTLFRSYHTCYSNHLSLAFASQWNLILFVVNHKRRGLSPSLVKSYISLPQIW